MDLNKTARALPSYEQVIEEEQPLNNIGFIIPSTSRGVTRQPPYPTGDIPTSPLFQPSTSTTPGRAERGNPPYPIDINSSNIGFVVPVPYPSQSPKKDESNVVLHSILFASSKRTTGPPAPPKTNAINDARSIQVALKGPKYSHCLPGLINLLTHRTHQQRLAIAEQYQKDYGKSLISKFKQHFQHKFGKIMVGLIVPYYEFLARSIHNSLSTRWLYYILFTIDNSELENLKIYFQKKYKQNLDNYVKNVSTFDRKRVGPIQKMLFARRSEEFEVNKEAVLSDLYWIESIESARFDDTRDTAIEVIENIFYHKSFAHINALNLEYNKRHYGAGLSSFLAHVFSSDSNIFTNILLYSTDPYKYLSSLLKKGLSGLFIDHYLLMHVVLRRSIECDIRDVAYEFERSYSGRLDDAVDEKITPENFKAVLMFLIE